MSFTTIRDGLVTVVATVTDIKKVLAYEPNMAEVSPIAWVLLDSYQRSTAGQIVPMRYRFVVRVAAPIQNTKEAEDLLMTAALQVPTAVDANPQFSGAITSGIAQSPDGATGWIMLGATKCRVVDVFVSVLDKQPYGG